MSHFNFHNYDNLRHFTKKHDPRRRLEDDPVGFSAAAEDPAIPNYSVSAALTRECVLNVQNKLVVNLLFAAYSGDTNALRR